MKISAPFIFVLGTCPIFRRSKPRQVGYARRQDCGTKPGCVVEQVLNPPTSKAEKRRGNRFPVVVPVQAKWQETSGKTMIETAQAREVNAQGGLLDMKVYPSVGSQMELTNLLTGETYRARG